MQPLLDLLVERTLQEELLDEAASSAQDAINNGLALYVDDQNESIRMILYEPKLIIPRIQQRESVSSTELVVGSIFFETDVSECGAWEITTTVAQKGYGPLMYDLAMSYIAPEFLISDRRRVSASARKIWNYMFTVRSNDYNIKPAGCSFYDKNGLGKPDFLNYAFSIKNPIDYKPLLYTHLDWLKKAEDMYIEDQYAMTLEGAAEEEFNRRWS